MCCMQHSDAHMLLSICSCLQYTSRAAQLYRQQLEKEGAKFRCVLAGDFDSLAIPLRNCAPAQCMLLQPATDALMSEGHVVIEGHPHLVHMAVPKDYILQQPMAVLCSHFLQCCTGT